MESVECVTAQVRRSHSRGGETKGSPVVVDELEGSARYLDGARRLIVLGGAGSAIVRALSCRSSRMLPT